MEIRLNETFSGDIDGESPVLALQALRDDKSRTARLAQLGLLFRDLGQVIFRDYAAKAALRVALEKAPTVRWIIGSNDARRSCKRPDCSPVTIVAHDERLDASRIERQPQRVGEVLEQFHYFRYQPGIVVLVKLDCIVWKPIL